LCSYIKDTENYNLTALYLNKCKLTDKEVQTICLSILDFGNRKISKLYFNQNDLKNKSALAVAELINDGNLKIKEIGLKWNKITAVGGNAIAAALKENVMLKVLDLSWNSIGIRPYFKP